MSYALSPMIRSGASSVRMKSNRPCTSWLSCGEALPVVTTTGSHQASTNTMMFTPVPALVTPTPSPPPRALVNIASMKYW
jgi:hypothetical protein